MKIKFTLFAFLVMATTSLMAQFSLSGEFRPRTEWIEMDLKLYKTEDQLLVEKDLLVNINTDVRV